MAFKVIWTTPSQTFGKILGWRLRYQKWLKYCVTSLEDGFQKLDMKEIILDGLDRNEYTMRDLGETNS